MKYMLLLGALACGAFQFAPTQPPLRHQGATVYGGSLAGNAQAKGSPPMLDYVLWTRPTIQDKDDDSGVLDAGSEAKDWLARVLEINRKIPNMPVMPGGFPIATNGLLIYRTYSGITAVNLRDALDKDGKVVAKAGSVHYKTTTFDGSLVNAMTAPVGYVTLVAWIDQTYRPSGFSNLVYENSTVGTLTTDNRLLYAVDDLAVPAPPKYLLPQFWNTGKYVEDDVKSLVEQNRLWAFDIANGSIKWMLGGPNDSSKSNEYLRTHFICAPISVGGKLYVLNEKNNGDLRLLCLDPKHGGKALNSPLKLRTIKNEDLYYKDLARRTSAIHLAHGEGVLVCPTNAGEIFGVDLQSGKTWAYPYRQQPPNPAAYPKKQPFQEPVPNGVIALSYSNWKAAPPVIVDGKVVFTAPDASAIHCINLRDGTEVWQKPRNDTDLYFAGVFDGKVLIVGKNSVRALRLADGKPLWDNLQTGDLPSGRGVASNNFYYLPLRKGEVLKIDLARWAIAAHNRASKTGGPAPGNLVFYEGMVLSQTPTAVVAYPQLSAKLQEVDGAYKKDPSLPNLLLRGELRLADGQLQAAVEDLAQVLDKEPQGDMEKRARNRLYEALTDLLLADFDKSAAKYLKRYRDLCKVPEAPSEEERRDAKYHYVVALGREAQGDLVSAFLAYRAFGASPLYKDDGVPSVDDPLYKVPTHLWLRGRITALFEKGTDVQKKALEAKIAEEWLTVKNKSDLEGMREFIAIFDVHFSVGREARLEVANLIIQQGQSGAFLEAEMNLQQLRVPQFRNDPATGGKALEALARLEMAKANYTALRLAAAYYREIYKDFSKVVLRDGKTGAELFNALATDRRLRPFLQEPGILWPKAEIKHRDLPGAAIQGFQGFAFQPEGDVTGPMQGHHLVLELNQNNPVLRLIDITTNKERWITSLGAAPANYLFFQSMHDHMSRPMGFYPNAKFRFYQVKGHLAVVQVGMMAYGVDMDSGKVLWNRLLFDNPQPPGTINTQLVTDEQGRFWVMYYNQFGGNSKVRVGQVGAVQATHVVLTTAKGLVVVDPLNGKTLWSKPGLSGNLEVFGDDQHIYYVEAAEGAGAVAAGRCLRASDGALIDIPDFGFHYRNHLRITGRTILSAEPDSKSLTLRLYDVQTGKDLWKRHFDNDPVALMTEDANLCGVIEKETGKIIVVDLRTFKKVLNDNVKRLRILSDDLKELHQPWLLEDNERFYVALNTRFSNKLTGGTVSNNFDNGTRCIPVNGWFCAFDKKNGEFWHGFERFQNQMLVVEQFKTLPILLFTSRYQELLPTGGVRNVSRTGSVHKGTGKVIRWSDRDTNGAAQFYTFGIDLKARTVNMIGYNGSVQHYVDENPLAKKD